MAKLIIAAACLIPGEDAAMAHADVGDTVDVPKETARELTALGRAYYLDASDDHTKGRNASGLLTASKDLVKQLKDQAAAIAEERAERARKAALAATGGVDIAAIIAETTKAVLAAQGAKVAA